MAGIRVGETCPHPRYTYGYGRAEDLAGAFIVLMILASAATIFHESIVKIVNPEPLSNLGWVAAAAVTGFVGNELVAWFCIKVGREINSAAPTRGRVHLLGGVGRCDRGVARLPARRPAGRRWNRVAILAIVWSTAREMWYRLMDATDPAVYDMVEKVAAAGHGVLDVHDVAVRWVGHRQRGELHVAVDGQIPTMEGHRIAEEVRLALRDALPALDEMTVHVDPDRRDTQLDHHTGHHGSHES